MNLIIVTFYFFYNLSHLTIVFCWPAEFLIWVFIESWKTWILLLRVIFSSVLLYLYRSIKKIQTKFKSNSKIRLIFDIVLNMAMKSEHLLFLFFLSSVRVKFYFLIHYTLRKIKHFKGWPLKFLVELWWYFANFSVSRHFKKKL